MKLIEFKSSLINAFKEMDEENEVPTASTKDLIEKLKGQKVQKKHMVSLVTNVT